MRVESCRGNDNDIDRGNTLGVSPQEGLPGLRSWAPAPRQVLGHRRLRDIDTELQGLAVNPRCAPKRIGTACLADRVSNIFGSPWSAGNTLRFPSPKRPEAAPMPANHRLGLDDDDRIQDARPQPIEPGEREPIGVAKPQPPRGRTAQQIDPMPQRQVFGLEPFT